VASASIHIARLYDRIEKMNTCHDSGGQFCSTGGGSGGVGIGASKDTTSLFADKTKPTEDRVQGWQDTKRFKQSSFTDEEWSALQTKPVVKVPYSTGLGVPITPRTSNEAFKDKTKGNEFTIEYQDRRFYVNTQGTDRAQGMFEFVEGGPRKFHTGRNAPNFKTK